MNESARLTISSTISGLIVGACVSLGTSWSDSQTKLADQVQQMQTTQSQIVYRLSQIEPVRRQTRNNSEMIRRLCNALEMPRCNISSALWHPGDNPGGPLPPEPTPASSGAVAHDKRRHPDAV